MWPFTVIVVSVCSLLSSSFCSASHLFDVSSKHETQTAVDYEHGCYEHGCYEHGCYEHGCYEHGRHGC